MISGHSTSIAVLALYPGIPSSTPPHSSAMQSQPFNMADPFIFGPLDCSGTYAIAILSEDLNFATSPLIYMT